MTTALGESTLAQLAVRLADYDALARQCETGPNAQTGRHLANSLITRPGNAVTDIVAVAEHFVVARLLLVMPTIAVEDLGTWTSRIKVWKRVAGVDLATFPHLSAFMGFVEVRNALAHGLGRLTERQLVRHRHEVLPHLAAAGVPLDGDLVLLESSDVRRCANISRKLIVFLDSTPRPAP